MRPNHQARFEASLSKNHTRPSWRVFLFPVGFLPVTLSVAGNIDAWNRALNAARVSLLSFTARRTRCRLRKSEHFNSQPKSTPVCGKFHHAC